MNTLFEHRKEDCERHAISLLKGEVQRLWDRCVVHIQQSMESRRYRDPRENDPDYGRRLRDLEGQIEAIDREQQGFHNINYPRPPKNETWQNKIMVGVAIVVIAAAILNAVATYTAVATLTTQLQMYIQANDKRMDSDETRIQDTERRLDRGAP